MAMATTMEVERTLQLVAIINLESARVFDFDDF